jgi:hypothetical protein
MNNSIVSKMAKRGERRQTHFQRPAKISLQFVWLQSTKHYNMAKLHIISLPKVLVDCNKKKLVVITPPD